MILDTLAAASKERAGELIKKYGLNALRREAEALPQVNRGFGQALKKQGLSFICLLFLGRHREQGEISTL